MFTAIDISNTISSHAEYPGGVLGPNGHIYFVPINANNIGVLNPSSSLSFTPINIFNTISLDWKYNVARSRPESSSSTFPSPPPPPPRAGGPQPGSCSCIHLEEGQQVRRARVRRHTVFDNLAPLLEHSADILVPSREAISAHSGFFRGHLLMICAANPRYTAAAAREHRRVLAPRLRTPGASATSPFHMP
jgi:hypothetical protein